MFLNRAGVGWNVSLPRGTSRKKERDLFITAGIWRLVLQSIALSPACRSVYTASLYTGQGHSRPSYLVFMLLHGVLHVDPVKDHGLLLGFVGTKYFRRFFLSLIRLNDLCYHSLHVAITSSKI